MKTRDHILQAATLRFSQCSYEEMKLRDIADDVGVDVALVHRAFGSKERLFAEVLKSVMRPEGWLDGDLADLIPHMARRVLADRSSRLGTVDPLQIVARSIASPKARELIRDAVLNDFIRPVSAKLSEADQHDATLFTACLFGISLMQHVVGLDLSSEETRPADEKKVEKVLAACLAE
ncbi:transcriptional regulator, TetR family [Faunimonas pinastri]|uniref:Transcriptional regulator, TetR family n=1 Tax=Faunimonas pinastri TaxID=1855383 RepID=A0A1H9B786_9HYPH|nr:TetR/AcrR family transcriptional regulator [Faunimonas pinastri]SEP84896.1 transcriptional regulator, TetR family [Faunimonas pinastri]